MYEVLETRGSWRVVLRRDDDAEQPYDDGATPILRLGSSRDYVRAYRAEAFNNQADAFVDAFNRFEDTGTGTELFARWVRIFHGARGVAEYNVGVSREYGYLAFDTAGWATEVGCPDDHRATAALESLVELEAWVEGDVWGWTVQRVTLGACGHDGCAEHTGWTEVESCWGLYGREYAEQAAREALTDTMKDEG